jgi:hypothetical protein
MLIARGLNKIHMLTGKALKNLPLTAKAFKEVVDSPLEFVIRRLTWAARHLRQENLPLSKSMLKVRSGICWKYYHQQTSNAAFDALWQSLEEQDAFRSLDAA